MARLCSSLLLSLLITSSASAVTMAWTPIGDPGNPADAQVMSDGTTGYGSVPYLYSIGTYEVTNSQYAEFLNAKAPSDPYGLYNAGMATTGITRSGSSGTYLYTTNAGFENRAVVLVSFYDALRFANWMNNNQGNGDTETGSYTLLGGTATPSNGTTVTRNAGTTIVLTSENEWYKAAYYSAATTSYYDYPTSSDTPPTCSAPTAVANHANCRGGAGHVVDVGSYPGSASPYGTFDEGGNVAEWNEAILTLPNTIPLRGIRGFAYSSDVSYLAASARGSFPPSEDFAAIGFRLVMIPEPGTGLLVVAGLVGLGVRRRMGQSAPTSNRPHEARRMGAAAGREYAVRREESFRQRCADHRILHRFECHHALGEPRQAHLQRRRDGHAVRQR
jgi:PEP-CTERM putative exosortase interaction domain